MNDRQTKQLAFLNSKENIVVGNIQNLPIGIDLLKDISKLKDLGYIQKEYNKGLTAIVYKLIINDKYFNLKVRRENSLVQNLDGELSFLNEVQRRRDFENIRKTEAIIDKGIVETIYADYRLGIIFSKWIKGDEPKEYNREVFKNIFQLTWSCERYGLMEWDLCPGNLLVDENNQITLFDFGYMYEHNPLKEYNSEGKSLPLFNNVERFETRAFIPYLLENKNRVNVLELYKIEKEEAVKLYIEKISWLKNNKADKDIIETNMQELNKWKEALLDDNLLKKTYLLESFRSYVLDINDDISGKSCTSYTLDKINEVIKLISRDYDFINKNNGFLWDDIGLSKDKLIDKYYKLLEIAKSYQL